MRLFATILFALLTPLPVFAQDWHQVPTMREDSHSFVDLAGIRTEGDLVVATMLIVRMPSYPGTNIRWALTRGAYDCTGNRMRAERFEAYGIDRKLAFALDDPDQGAFRNVEPGTDAETVSDFVCGRKRDGSLRVPDPWVVLPRPGAE